MHICLCGRTRMILLHTGLAVRAYTVVACSYARTDMRARLNMSRATVFSSQARHRSLVLEHHSRNPSMSQAHAREMASLNRQHELDHTILLPRPAYKKQAVLALDSQDRKDKQAGSYYRSPKNY